MAVPNYAVHKPPVGMTSDEARIYDLLVVSSVGIDCFVFIANYRENCNTMLTC